MPHCPIEEEIKDTKGVIRIRISKKNRQCNGQKKKDERTNFFHIIFGYSCLFIWCHDWSRMFNRIHKWKVNGHVFVCQGCRYCIFHVKQELPTLPEHLSSPPVFSGVALKTISLTHSSSWFNVTMWFSR
jgi:hypothetical protein